MGRKLTLRGEILQFKFKALFDYEGTDLTRGWKIISAEVIELTAPSRECLGVILHTNDAAVGSPVFSNNQVLGYAARGVYGAPIEMLDPDHVIVNTLYITGLSANTSYIIVLEEMKLDPTQNVVYQLKERAQASLV